MIYRPKIDFHLIGPVLILVILSLTTLASINIVYFRSQFISLIIGVILFLLFSHFNFRSFRTFKGSLYVASLILLAIVLIIGIESRGSVRWIEILGIRFQFSEILKPVLAIVFASHITNTQNISFRKFFKMNLLLFPLLVLIYLQPDLGSALVYAGVFYLTLLTIGYSYKWFAGIFLPLAALLPFFWSVLHDYQRQRIITFMNPLHDPSGASYNSIQAIIAIGSGMLSGRGFGESTQSGLRFLPERQTDFIFATISEGLGFIGSFIVIFAFVFLFIRMFKIFLNSEHDYDRILILSSFFFIFLQFLFNIGMNLGLVPVVGITLPFVSFGGSSLISNFIFLAIVNSISTEQNKKQILEIK